MKPLVPELAVVRPRVRCAGSDSPRLLEDVIEEYAEDSPSGFLWLLGSEGAGKTTALAHLSEVFKGDQHFAFIDDADNLESTTVCENYHTLGDSVLVIAARHSPISTGHKVLQLEPWRVDELIEYLLAAHHSHCGEVLQRLGDGARQSWNPRIARIILEQLVSNQELHDASSALLDYLHHELPGESQFEAARKLCLAYQKGGSGEALLSLPPSIGLIPLHVKKLLKDYLVQVPLAAEQVSLNLTASRSPSVLEGQLSLELVEFVGKTCRSSPKIQQRLENILTSSKHSKCHSMAASILHAADPCWRPKMKTDNRDYSGAYFSKAIWCKCRFLICNYPASVSDCRHGMIR